MSMLIIFLVLFCSPAGSVTAFRAEFSEQLERTINTVLCAVQGLVKRREREEEQPEDNRKGVHS